MYCIDERPKGLHTYIEEGTPNPRLEYNYHYTLNTNVIETWIAVSSFLHFRWKDN